MRARPTLCALLALAAGAAGCGTASTRPAGGAGSAPAGPRPPLQTANGPLAPAAATSPLTLQLGGVPDAVQIRFGRPPRSGLLFDLDTGRVLWRKDPTRVLPIASLTKMMTALVVVARVPDGAKVKVTKEALAYQGSGVGVLPKGKSVGLSAMLHGLLLPSGNDAAIALAQRADGTLPRFVADMNARTTAMGLSCTHYSSPSGFTDRGNHSCAADLAVEARAVLDQPRLARIVRRRQAVLPFPIKGGKLYLYNNNPLLRMRYPGTLGIKTGFTDAAGRCLVAAVRRGDHRLGVVLLHSPDPGGQAVKLLDRGFRALG
ncbi:D-alanyl-D-alanine carboxypeptidase family protein [Baekduia soli]|uniref:D-alanyl-D-alanine carboxypeptidase family protein n=1 Tax=Baekduia soli TaxID=496014 RepID=UPI001652A619|nr:D-alanyl-D-alanine carboxypeptidase [Baekduia soli]